jgi:hypothetical protein
MKQKFKAFSFVRVCDEMPQHMVHFDKGFDAVVRGTYSQIYGGKDIDSYSLFKIRNGKIIATISWYDEDQLTQIDNAGDPQEMVEDYHLR